MPAFDEKQPYTTDETNILLNNCMIIDCESQKHLACKPSFIGNSLDSTISVRFFLYREPTTVLIDKAITL